MSHNTKESSTNLSEWSDSSNSSTYPAIYRSLLEGSEPLQDEEISTVQLKPIGFERANGLIKPQLKRPIMKPVVVRENGEAQQAVDRIVKEIADLKKERESKAKDMKTEEPVASQQQTMQLAQHRKGKPRYVPLQFGDFRSPGYYRDGNPYY